MATTFLAAVMVLSGKSVTYRATLPLSRAAIMSSSTTRPPRARLMMRTPVFIWSKAVALSMPLVSLVWGTWMVM